MVELVENENVSESWKEIIDWTKKSLSLLEKETRINFFKRAWNWLKRFFGFNDNDGEDKSSLSLFHNKENGNTSLSSMSQDKESGSDSNDNINEHISKSAVKRTRNYISNWWTFYSPSLWTITWGVGKYKHVCSTWSYNVLWQLWLPKVSTSTECDLKWKILPKMGLEYIWDVDPNNPEKNWYKPQDGDTAVWPKFKNGRKITQHQATFINWHWVSDTIQSKMSCYSSRNEPMVKVYRYKWKNLT